MAGRSVLKRRPSKRVAILLALLAVVVVAGGSGWWAWNNLRPKEPQVIYVVYDPGSTATVGPTASPDEASPTTESTASATASATTSATATPPPVPGATPSPKPDLAVDPLLGLPLTCNEQSPVWTNVRNDGTVATPRATTARLTDMYGGHEAYSNVYSIPVLAPGAEMAVGWNVTINTGCNETHIMLIEIDPDHLVDETDEGNNVQHSSYLLAGKPDLRTYGITISPEQPFCNEQFTATISLRNTGTVLSGSGLVRFVDTYEGEIQAGPYVSFPPIPAGGHVFVHVNFTLTEHCALWHRITVYIDPANDIDEVYETNNTWSKDYPLYIHR